LSYQTGRIHLPESDGETKIETKMSTIKVSVPQAKTILSCYNGNSPVLSSFKKKLRQKKNLSAKQWNSVINCLRGKRNGVQQ